MGVFANLQHVLAALTGILWLVASTAIPSKPKGTLLLATNAIAFRSNALETAHIGAEVYLHRRDINGFRLAQLIDVESGAGYALMSFPMSFGITAEVGDDMVDLSFDFQMDEQGRRTVTYYSSDLKQTLHLPPRALTAPNLLPPDPNPRRGDLRRRGGDEAAQHLQQLEENHRHYLPKFMTASGESSTSASLASSKAPTITVTVQDACAQPINTLSSLELSCTPVRYGQIQGIETADSPYRGAAKWLWRAKSKTQLHQTSPGVFTGQCDMTTAAAAAQVHQACAERMRNSGDGFQSLCRPLEAVLDLRRDLRYMIAHTYEGEYVALSKFLSLIRPAFTAYESACAYYSKPELQPMVDVQLAAEECGYPPEIALEVRGKDVIQMLGSISAASGDFSATVTAKNAPTQSACLK